MRTKPLLLFPLLLTVFFNACNKLTPAGFWKGYQKDFLVKVISDQGHWGGHRAIYWKSGKNKTFNSSDALAFAKKNAWIVTDSLEFNEGQVNKWTTYDKKAVFPLTSTGFSEAVLNSTQLEYFPRWFGGEVKLYKFTTGVLTIEPGTDDYIEENGFLLINKEQTEMAVYHLWGE